MAGALVQQAVLPSGVTTGDDSKIRGTWLRNGNASRIVITASLNSVRNSNRFLGCFPLRNQELKCHRGRTRSSRRKLCTVASFSRFTEQALMVILRAQREARRLGHNFVGKEMILLGLIGEGTSRAAKVLTSMGINLKDARVEVEKIIGKGSDFVGAEIPFTARAKRVLELALQEANKMGHKVGSEHLLLGLLREGEGEGVAASMVESLGADPNSISTQVVRMVGEITETVGDGVGGGSSEHRTNLTKLAEELIAEHLSEDETARLNEIFKMIDTDNSGDAGAPESEEG